MDCPCRLNIYEDGLASEVTLWRGGRESASYSCGGGVCGIDISRGRYVISVSRGEPCASDGSQSDSIYAWCSLVELDCRGDSISLRPELTKQFSTLSVFLTGSGLDGLEGGDDEFFAEVSGGAGGVSLMTLRPVAGGFRYGRECSLPGTFSVRLPRQDGNSPPLTMTLSGKGRELLRLPLSAAIDSVGFDWDAVNLDDIYMEVDLASGEMKASIVAWQMGFEKTETL